MKASTILTGAAGRRWFRLVRSTLGYVVYFGTAVLNPGALGFNPMPFLAGAGILGLVIGFRA